jgi:Multicopper oxidase
MNRRKFLAYGMMGGATAALAASGTADAQVASSIVYELDIEPVDVEMIDGVLVYMLLYYSRGTGPSTPRPCLTATEGDRVTIRVRNNAPEAHRFQIPGVTGAAISSIAPGRTREVTFTAPVAGTYLYLDPLNAPVYRLCGLHGAFVVRPRGGGLTTTGKPTPYSTAMHTPALEALFNAFGTSRFPGDAWNPNDPERQKVWVLSQTDPALNRRVERREVIDPATVVSTFTPRYFTINGLSGFDLDDEPTVEISGYEGQPTLIRTLNAGLATHSPHIHGNHIMLLSGTRTGGQVVVRDNIFELDAWALGPLDRKDVLLPIERPPDIPLAAWPPTQEPFPMRYVMHCHSEMSQTAGGGNYPNGIVMHWSLLGPRRSV